MQFLHELQNKKILEKEDLIDKSVPIFLQDK
jgi:hypothetical protein